MAGRDVILRGEDGVIWTFALPLAEPYVDQIRVGKLVPADEESAEIVAGILASSIDTHVSPFDAPPPKVGAGSSRDAWAAYAESLGIEAGEMTRAELIAAVEAATDG